LQNEVATQLRGNGLKVVLRLVGAVLLCGAAYLAIADTKTVQAQDAATDCRPHSKEEGPWKCTPAILNAVKCNGEKIDGLDPAFRGVTSKEDAFAVLRAKYLVLDNAADFISWLRCQKFRGIEVQERPASSFPDCDCERPLAITAQYSRQDVTPYPLRWYRLADWWVWGSGDIHEAFFVVLDEFGTPKHVSVSRMF
jgi:hypothetical protein